MTAFRNRLSRLAAKLTEWREAAAGEIRVSPARWLRNDPEHRRLELAWALAVEDGLAEEAAAAAAALKAYDLAETTRRVRAAGHTGPIRFYHQIPYSVEG